MVLALAIIYAAWQAVLYESSQEALRLLEEISQEQNTGNQVKISNAQYVCAGLRSNVVAVWEETLHYAYKVKEDTSGG